MILSIDIGLRNLALCCMSAENPLDLSTYKIHLWNVYNVLESDEHKCKSLQKNKQICGKKCILTYIDSNNATVYSCKNHFPKSIDITKTNVHATKKVNEYMLQTIALLFIQKIQDIYDQNIETFSKVQSILIELQPQLNPKMKLISHILFGKFVELYKNTDVAIKFVRAASKSNIAYDGPELTSNLKSVYAKRKWLSIQHIKYFLENKFSEEQKNLWLPQLLESKNKIDDMCDSCAMSINALYGIPKKIKVKSVKKDKTFNESQNTIIENV